MHVVLLFTITIADLNDVNLLFVNKLLHLLRYDAFVYLTTVRLVLQSTQFVTS